MTVAKKRARHELTLGAEHLVELRQIRQYAQLVGNFVVGHVLGVQQGRDAQILFCHTESQLIVLIDVLPLEFFEVSVVQRDSNEYKRGGREFLIEN